MMYDVATQHLHAIAVSLAGAGIDTSWQNRLTELGITTVALLITTCGPRTSQLQDDLDDTEVNALYAYLQGNGDDESRKALWGPTQEQTAAFLISARLMLPSLGSIGAPPPPGPGGAPPLNPSKTLGGTASEIKEVSDFFDLAEKANSKLFPASSRPKYSSIKIIHDGYRNRHPANIPLGEWALQLTSSSGASKKVEIAGTTFEAPNDWAPSKITISTREQLWAQMTRRNIGECVAGCFDANTLLWVSHKHADSLLHYVAIDPTNLSRSAAAIDAFATHEIGLMEIEKLQTFSNKHQQLPTKALVYVDEQVRREVADMLLRGYTRDQAIFVITTTRADLYSISNIPSHAQASGSDDPKITPKKPSAGGKSPEDADAKHKRQMEQKDREIANLKNGKKPAYKIPKVSQPYMGPPPTAYQQSSPQTPATTFTKVACPPDVCRDFNFKASGCTRGAACTWKHTCATCGNSAHGHKGNH